MRGANLGIVGTFLAGLFLVHCGSDDSEGGPSGGSGGTATGGGAGAAGEAGSGGSSGSATGGTGASDTGGTGGTGGTGEGTICEQRCAITASLGCPNDALCVQNCEGAIAYASWCSTIMTAFVTCAAGRPAEDWVCDGSGQSVLKAGVCETEATAGVQCLAKGPPEGMPDLSAQCAATCVAMAGLECTPENCEQTCNDSIANSPCAGAMGLVTVCGAELKQGDYECVQGAPVPTGGKCSDEIQILLACIQAQNT